MLSFQHEMLKAQNYTFADFELSCLSPSYRFYQNINLPNFNSKQVRDAEIPRWFDLEKTA